jgi:pimeloyl-ACP methyl ester carboxylesterase
MDTAKQLAQSHEIGTKITLLYQRRTKNAMEQFRQRTSAAIGGLTSQAAGAAGAAGAARDDASPAWIRAFNPWLVQPGSFQNYAVDAIQRAILFWDTIRRRGDNFIERASKGSEPVLHFDYETILDGRRFQRPVNYMLLRVKPPDGVVIDPDKRPYLIIDPRAGHGPGIGGFKDDSQAGVAMRAGHPVYLVSFVRDPEPGQTLLDVCSAEQQFVKHVRALHPRSDKPAIIGNCQGGWAAMMLAASGPDDTGPIVINGAPMAYVSGAWSEGENDNPMRYAGGMLGGTWMSSFAADLGNGVFDGAHLVQNFENLNPANSLWDKYYKVYKNADSEPARYLDFERWWGTYYLMNREEIEFITRNLFVGNKLWSGEVKGSGGQGFDLRAIEMPIILFASMGDNITPPEQAFNWVADTYGSTEEIKARGQVIVGLLHPDIGHLGIFVSGKVAKKEYTQLVSVLNEVELLPPGLYAMQIDEIRDQDAPGKVRYEVSFHEHRLEDIVARINRFGRVDEKPFEAVAALSEFNQRAYELFARPFVQAMSNDMSARLLRIFHPLRVQNWALSSRNPWMAWLEPAAQAVIAHRHPLDAGDPWRRLEDAGAELVSASLDLYRGLRDARTEASFFGIYANMYAFYLAGKQPPLEAAAAEARALPFVQQALASIAEGGYTEAFARVASLHASHLGETLPLSRLVKRKELAQSYAEYMPDVPLDQWRRIRGEQEIITHYAPEQALATLPDLLRDRADRERLLALIDKLMADPRVQATQPSEAQLAMVERLRELLHGAPAQPPGFAHAPQPPASSRLH